MSTYIYPIPAPIPPMPQDLDRNMALALLRQAQVYVNNMAGRGYICNGIGEACEAVSDADFRRATQTSNALCKIIHERLNRENTYGCWLRAYWPDEWRRGIGNLEKLHEQERASRLVWLDSMIKEVRSLP